MGVGLPPPGSEPDRNESNDGGRHPSQLHTHFGLHGKLIEIETFKGTSDSHHLCIHTPGHDETERRLLLISAPHSDPSDTAVTGYSLQLTPENNKEMLRLALELLRNGEIERLERLFITSQALPLSPITAHKSTQELSIVSFPQRAFFGDRSPDIIVERPNGARILQWNSATEQHAIVRIEASKDGGSEALGLHISREILQRYAHYVPMGIAKAGGGFEELSIALKQLSSRSDEVPLQAILEPLTPFIMQNVYFPQSAPTSRIAQSLLDLWHSDAKPGDPAIMSRYLGHQLTFLDQVEHILKHRDQIVVSLNETLRSTSLWKSMVLHISDDGRGCIALFAGGKRVPFDYDRIAERILGGVSLEYDLSDLTPHEQTRWLNVVARAFASSYAEFPGDLGERISREFNAEMRNGAPRLMWRGMRNFVGAHLSPERSVSYFISKLQDAFGKSELPCSIIARSHAAAVVRATNPQGDQIEFTVRPDGIDDAYLFPRNNNDPAALCLGYSFEHLYQLGPEFALVAQNIAHSLKYPSKEARPIPSYLQRGVDSAPIGAQACHHYLRGHTALNQAMRDSYDYACIVPKPAIERLKDFDQTGKRIGNPVAQVIKPIRG